MGRRSVVILLGILALWIPTLQAFEGLPPELVSGLKLTEETHLTGDLLQRLIAQDRRFEKIEAIDAYQYELEKGQWSASDQEAFLAQLIQVSEPQGWKLLRRRIPETDEGTLTLYQELEGSHRFWIIHVDTGGVSSVTLRGEADLPTLLNILEESYLEATLEGRQPPSGQSGMTERELPEEAASPSVMRSLQGKPAESPPSERAERREEGRVSREIEEQLRLAISYEEGNRPREAISLYTQVLETAPPGVWIPFGQSGYRRILKVAEVALHGRARCLESVGNYGGALKDYQQLQQQFPRTRLIAAARLAERRIPQLQGRTDLPQDLRRAMALLFHQGSLTLYLKEDVEEAQKRYAEVVERYPDTSYAASALAMLAYTFQWSNKPWEAYRAWLKLGEYPATDLNSYELARSYARIGHDESALRLATAEFERLLKDFPESEFSPESIFHLAHAYELLGMSYQAQQRYEQFLKRTSEQKSNRALDAAIRLERIRRGTDHLPFLGVGLRDVGGRVVVNRVLPGTPAEAAGLRKGDVILAVEDTAIGERSKEVTLAVLTHEIGDAISLRVLRGGKEVQIPVTLE